MNTIYFKNIVHLLKYYFRYIYEKEDKTNLKSYKLNYLDSDITLYLPQIIIDYVNKNKQRLIKNTINSSYVYCYMCDEQVKVNDKYELSTINKIHSIYEIIKECWEDMLDDCMIYIAICNSCSNESNSSCSSKTSTDNSEDDGDTNSDF